MGETKKMKEKAGAQVAGRGEKSSLVGLKLMRCYSRQW
jgi:hypothetical protein